MKIGSHFQQDRKNIGGNSGEYREETGPTFTVSVNITTETSSKLWKRLSGHLKNFYILRLRGKVSEILKEPLITPLEDTLISSHQNMQSDSLPTRVKGIRRKAGAASQARTQHHYEPEKAC